MTYTMLKKNLTLLYVREKISNSRGLGKKILAQTKSLIPLPPPPHKSQMGNHIGGGEEAGEFDTLVDVCLVPRPHFSAPPKRCGPRGPCENVRAFPARSPRIRHRNKLTERDWENAVQGLGKVYVIRQENGWRAFIMWWFLRLKFCISRFKIR